MCTDKGIINFAYPELAKLLSDTENVSTEGQNYNIPLTDISSSVRGSLVVRKRIPVLGMDSAISVLGIF